jgi:hypothetical protein
VRESAYHPKCQFATVNYCIAKGSFDHLVGNREHRRGHLDAERSRRLKVEGELEFGSLQHRKVGGLFALKSFDAQYS